jgi:hypothetical protein
VHAGTWQSDHSNTADQANISWMSHMVSPLAKALRLGRPCLHASLARNLPRLLEHMFSSPGSFGTDIHRPSPIVHG